MYRYYAPNKKCLIEVEGRSSRELNLTNTNIFEWVNC